MMIMAFVGGKHSAQAAMAKQLKSICNYNVKHISNNPRDWSDDEKYTRLRQALRLRKNNGMLLVVTGISTQLELSLLRRYGATICIPDAPLHSLFDTNEITSSDVFVCKYPSILDTPQKRAKYMTPEEAFSFCYSRMRGFKDES